MSLRILCGDWLEQLKTLPDESVQCCVTSPPYWGLRNYGVKGQLGLEKTPEEYVSKLVEGFREVRRVLKGDGVLWLNLGDSYCAPSGRSNGGTYKRGPNSQMAHMHEAQEIGTVRNWSNLKPKDLVGIPWLAAFALRNDGWYLRCDIIWNKRNCMPESVTDRPTKSHEYIFLLSKSQKYYYDHEAILEPCSEGTHARISQDLQNQIGTFRANGGNKTNGAFKPAVTRRKIAASGSGIRSNESYESALCMPVEARNKRSVWTVQSAAFRGAHFATYPPDLIKPCILAGSRPGDVVLDPFGGSGTTGMVALEFGRQAVLIELNPAYVELIKVRCSVTPGLPLHA